MTNSKVLQQNITSFSYEHENYGTYKKIYMYVYTKLMHMYTPTHKHIILSIQARN